MLLVSSNSKAVPEERGCSSDGISSPCLLDLAVARVSIVLVGERGRKTLMRTHFHIFFVANTYFFCLHSELLEAVCISLVQRLIRHVTRYDLNRVIRSYVLDPGRAGTSHVIDTTAHAVIPSPALLSIGVSFSHINLL